MHTAICEECGQTTRVPFALNGKRFHCGCQNDPAACMHRGEPTGETRSCRVCGKGTVEIPVYACPLYGECLLRRPVLTVGHWDGGVCLTCIDRQPDPRLADG